MEIIVSATKQELGEKAALQGAGLIRQAITRKGSAHIIVATGASQFEMLEALVKQDLDWSRVTGFHLDEYIGIPESHPASFRKYLKERFTAKLDLHSFHFVNGEGDPEEECLRLNALISSVSIDVAFVGIGENGHLAFNDPPADFQTEDPFMVVTLDKPCRLQQMGEGWFGSLEEVPEKAISMSVKQIMKSQNIICSVPDARKAEAVKGTIEGSVSPHVPASILQQHNAAWIYLDKPSASLLQ